MRTIRGQSADKNRAERGEEVTIAPLCPRGAVLTLSRFFSGGKALRPGFPEGNPGAEVSPPPTPPEIIGRRAQSFSLLLFGSFPLIGVSPNRISAVLVRFVLPLADGVTYPLGQASRFRAILNGVHSFPSGFIPSLEASIVSEA